MLIQMRSKAAKIVTSILFALLILSFAIWGIGDIFRTGRQATIVAEVGDVKITQNEFSRDLTREMNTLRQRFGGQFDIAQAQALGIVDQILQQMVTRALFEQQAKDLRMIVREDELRSSIRKQPAFLDEVGNFDRFRFEQVLRSNGLSEGQFLAILSSNIKRQQIVAAVTGAGEAPRPLAEALYTYQQERRVAETLSVSAEGLPPPGEPSAEDLQKVYEEHAERFQAPEYRSITLLQITAEDLAKDISVSEEQLREEFEVRREEFGTPEMRGIEQIVLPDEAAALAAKAELEEGKAFAAVAQATLGRDPVDLGMVSREDLDLQLPELAEAAFALEAGSISAPIESPLGWHILHITKIVPAKEPDFEAAREGLAQELTTRAAVDAMVELANELDEELGSGASFEEAAELLQLDLRTIPAIDNAGKDPEGKTIEGLPPLDELSEAVFQTPVGQESLLIESRDGDYFAVRVDGVTPAATRPLDEVRDQVVALWKELETDRLTRERAEALAKRIEDGEDFAAVAEAEGLEVVVTEPISRQQTESAGLASRELTAKLFEIDKGEVTTARGTNGYVVAKLTEIRPADLSSDAEAVAALQDRLAESLRNDLLSAFIATLRAEMGVEINERVVEDTTSAL